MANILVTGGAGYIGSHACKQLKQAGHTPICFDSFTTGWKKAVKFGPLEEGDLLDAARLDDVFKTHKPDAVMHFAALSNVGEATKEPGIYWRNNVIGSLNLINACVANDVKNFVFSSTCATYGDQDGVVLTENSDQQPLNAYGASKLAVEHILKDYQVHGLNHVIFRYFNVAGADPEAEIGEHHRPETHLIPLALDAMSGRRAALTLFGDDYDTRDGTCVRDYIHVTDLIDAHIRGLEWLLAGKTSEVFNLGTGTGFTVKEVIDGVKSATGEAVPMVLGERRIGDATALVSGSTKAKELLGWEPAHSTMDEMVKTAWAWHQKGDIYAE